MKRSTMVAQISIKLEELIAGTQGQFDYSEDARSILDLIEEYEMLPPKSEPTYHKSTGKQLLSENKWDEE